MLCQHRQKLGVRDMEYLPVAVRRPKPNERCIQARQEEEARGGTDER